MKKNKWIILRGLGRGCGHWGHFPEKFRAAFPNDHFYYLDLQGNGLLNHEKSPLKISDYIPAMEAQLKRTDFFDHDGPAYGLGLSLGGMIITEWAQQHPERFQKIALINTSSCNFSLPWKRLSFLVFFGAFKQALTKDIEQFEMNSLLVTTSLKEKDILNRFRENYQANVEFTKRYPILKINVQRQVVAAARYFFPKHPPVPTLLINGARDRFVHPDCSHHIQTRWRCPIVTHPQAGHDIAFEDSEWLIKILKDKLMETANSV